MKKTTRTSRCETSGCRNTVKVWIWEGRCGRIEQWREDFLEAVTIPENAPELLAMPGIRPHNRRSEPGTVRLRFPLALVKPVGRILRVPRGAISEIESWAQ